MILIGYHPDFGNGRRFKERSQLATLAKVLDIPCVFPSARWAWWFARGWRDKDDRNGLPSYELDDFDKLLHNYGADKSILCGYSDGAGVANYIGTYRSDKVLAVVSYAGRLQRDSFRTSNPYPVLDCWNKFDARYGSKQHAAMAQRYTDAGHAVTTLCHPNNKTHAAGWDASYNAVVEEFLRGVVR